MGGCGGPGSASGEGREVVRRWQGGPKPGNETAIFAKPSPETLKTLTLTLAWQVQRRGVAVRRCRPSGLRGGLQRASRGVRWRDGRAAVPRDGHDRRDGSRARPVDARQISPTCRSCGRRAEAAPATSAAAARRLVARRAPWWRPRGARRAARRWRGGRGSPAPPRRGSGGCAATTTRPRRGARCAPAGRQGQAQL